MSKHIIPITIELTDAQEHILDMLSPFPTNIWCWIAKSLSTDDILVLWKYDLIRSQRTDGHVEYQITELGRSLVA